MKTKETGSGYRKPVIVVLGIVLVTLLLGVGTQRWLAHRARQVIEQKLARSGIRLEIGNIRVGLVGRSLTLNDVTMEIDSGALQGAKGSAPGLHVEFDQLALSGIGWTDRNGRRSIRLERILFKSPRAVLDQTAGKSPQKIASLPDDSLSRKPVNTTWAEDLSIGQIQIEDGYVEYHLHRGTGRSTYTVKGLQVQVDDFEPESLWSQNLLAAGNVQVAMERVDYRYDDQAFLLEADTVVLKNYPADISVAAARLIPRYPKNQFAQQAPDHADWMQFVSGPITLSGVEIRPAAHRPEVIADSLRVRDLTFDCYKNRKIPQPSRIRPLSFESLQRLPIGLQLDKVYVQNLNASYQELAPKGEEPGSISFNDLNAEISGLTNIPSAERSFYRLDARCRLMDTADLSASFLFPIDSLTDRFEIRGKLGPMPMQALNRMVEPLSGAQIQRGTVRGMDFEIQGTSRSSQVNLTLLYDDLWVEIVQDKHGKLREKVLATFLVDHFLLRTGNPDRHGMHQGTGTFTRNPYRSQFNYWWKSLWPGLKRTLL